MAGAGAKPFVDKKLAQRKVLLFSKTTSPACKTIKEIMTGYGLKFPKYEVVEIENRQDCNQIENYFQILCLTDRRDVSELSYLFFFIQLKYIHVLRKKYKESMMVWPVFCMTKSNNCQL